MNFAMIFRILGWMMMFEAAFMAPSGVAALIYRERAGLWLAVSMVICLSLEFWGHYSTDDLTMQRFYVIKCHVFSAIFLANPTNSLGGASKSPPP